jgi:hypothetical protein
MSREYFIGTILQHDPLRDQDDNTVIIALASPRVASSIDDGLERIHRLLGDASARGAEIVCFPEA